MIEKTELMNSLLDVYADLLTLRQQKVMKEYYYEDYSLSEIAQRLNISRSGVSDHLQRSEKALLHLESTLQIIDKAKKRKEIYDKIKTVSNQEVKKYIVLLEKGE